jgi:hypothetical protein
MKKKDYVLVLRTNNEDMTAYNNFKWPTKGPVRAPDWRDTAECGNGLHGAKWGVGNGNLFKWDTSAKWLVVRVAAADIIDLDDKVKFPKGTVVFCGDRAGATGYLRDHLPVEERNNKIIGLVARVGDNGHVVGGAGSTVSGGDWSTVSGGAESTVSGGAGSTVSGGAGSTVSGGAYSTVTGGAYSTVTGGYDSTVTGGYDSTVSGGYGSILQFKWYDGSRYRVATAYVGENGILPDTKYRVDNGNWIKG